MFNVNGQPDKNDRRMAGLLQCLSCSQIANVFTRTGIKFQQVTGMLHDPACWKEISGWVEAAAVANIMQNNRLGCMGHYYSGMLDIYTDLTEQYAYFGGHIELLEVEELAALRKQVTIEAVKGRLKLLLKHLMYSPDCPAGELEKAAVTAVAP